MKRQVLEVLSGKGNTSALTTNDLFILVNETTEITDIFVTGGTYSSGTTEFTFTNNTGGTFNVTGFYIPSATTAYKVFTALLTQSGGDAGESSDNINQLHLQIGRTYYININDNPITDFTTVGAPNNNVETYFVATGTTVAWPSDVSVISELTSNTGAPVATVLENTIGNIWFTYGGVGTYNCNSNGLFSLNKTTANNAIFYNGDADAMCSMYVSYFTINDLTINSSILSGAGTNVDNLFNNVFIEIRVYN